jgi:WD40 repeat protein
MAADGDKLAIGHRNGQITIWAIPEGDHLFSMNEGVHAMILTLKFVTNNRLVSVCRGNSVCVWNLNKKADDSLDEPVLSEFPTHFERYQWQKKCAKIRRERAGQPMPICTKLITDDPTGITITPRGTHVFIASGSSIRWWALNGQEEETPDNRQYASHFDGHDVNFTCIAFSDDGTKMASYSVDQSVRIWDVFTCKFQVVLEGHEHHVFGEKTQFSPDGKTLASRDGGVLRLWNVA